MPITMPQVKRNALLKNTDFDGTLTVKAVFPGKTAVSQGVAGPVEYYTGDVVLTQTLSISRGAYPAVTFTVPQNIAVATRMLSITHKVMQQSLSVAMDLLSTFLRFLIYVPNWSVMISFVSLLRFQMKMISRSWWFWSGGIWRLVSRETVRPHSTGRGRGGGQRLSC